MLDVAVEGGQAARKMLFVVEALPHGAGVVGFEGLGDLIVEGGDLSEDRRLAVSVGVVGEIGADELAPFGSAALRLTRMVASGLGDGDRLGDGVTAYTQASSNLVLLWKDCVQRASV